jgi:excisionase family DNA binding protein
VSDPLLTTRQVAEMLNVCPETVLRWWRAGRLPGFRLPSGALRFSEREIEGCKEQWRGGREPPSVSGVDFLALRREG